MIERPTYDGRTGRFAGFEAGWCDPAAWNWAKRGPRTFCVDMGGFAFDTALLQQVEGPLWDYKGHGGESEFISKLLPGGVPEDLQPLANCGQDVLIFHNEYRTVPVPVRRPRGLCGFDGWGVADDMLRRDEPQPLWPSVYRNRGLALPKAQREAFPNASRGPPAAHHAAMPKRAADHRNTRRSRGGRGKGKGASKGW